jgi:hypothetical protein
MGWCLPSFPIIIDMFPSFSYRQIVFLPSGCARLVLIKMI